MLMTAAKLMIVALAAGRLLWGASQAMANYPPPVGSLSAGASDTTPEPGSDVTVTCTVLDSSGNPMANELCTFVITSQPGGASFDGSSSTTGVTDANGVATAVLSAGATPGTIVLETQSGAMSSQVTLTTGAEPAELPSTGGAPGETGSAPWPLAAGAAAGAMALGLAGAFMALRARRSGSAS